MNIITVNSGAFANGFDFFCTDCGMFFSAQVSDGWTDDAFMKHTKLTGKKISFCPSCGGDDLITTIEDLLAHCSNYDADPVNFFNAFPPDEPIPGSRTGATPRQVTSIIEMVVDSRRNKLPVIVESIVLIHAINPEIVKSVFDELLITETGGI